MSSFPSVTTSLHERFDAIGRTAVIDNEQVTQLILDALEDNTCRRILECTFDEPLSAREISEVWELPLSTAYRKLDMLSESGLLVERTRICLKGKHASEFVNIVENVIVSVGPDEGPRCSVSYRKPIGRSSSNQSIWDKRTDAHLWI